MEKVQQVTKERMAKLKEANSGKVFEDDYMDTEVGMRGLIKVFDPDDEEVRGLEFIEPEEFWADPDALEEYAETLSDEIAVTVIVPAEEKGEATEMLHEAVGKKVVVLGYDEIGNSLQL